MFWRVINAPPMNRFVAGITCFAEAATAAVGVGRP
jgi:hypothetical protein